MEKKITSLLGAFLLYSGLSLAQQTGSFNTTVIINGENRTLSCYVPADYDTGTDYAS